MEAIDSLLSYEGFYRGIFTDKSVSVAGNSSFIGGRGAFCGRLSVYPANLRLAYGISDAALLFQLLYHGALITDT